MEIPDQDITKLKRLGSASILLGAIVDSSDDAIISKDLNGRITSWNKGAERIFGYTQQEAIGRPITMIIPPDRLHEEVEILSKIRTGQKVDHLETVRLGKGSRTLHISVTISPIRDAEGEVIGASKIARDITDKKQQKQDLALRDSKAIVRIMLSPSGMYLQ